ncbi:MAG: Crp/Fnr family transcriptional regulator, partial [Alphaproteobacteria bacterium]|nr:Crp/Fnr family transcriptional regulator [Alphaproteobacteria bacterium]
GATLFQQGDEGSSMMAILRGRVRVSAVSGEGREITLNIIGPGEVVGEIALLDSRPRSADVTTIEETHLLVVERRHFVPFLQRNQDLQLRMLRVLCDKLRRTSTALEELALLELPARLARLLLKFAEDFGCREQDGIRIDFKLVHRDLASRVASTRETVAKQMKGWERQGIVRQERTGYYVVLRPQELQDLAH